jgi:outer membrane lipoprotein LolB
MIAARRATEVLALALLFVLVGGCSSSVPMRAGADDPLAARRAALAALADWSYAGRAALSDGRNAVTVRIDWRQRGDSYEVTLRAPVSGETWRLHGDRTGAVLEGGGGAPRRDRDAEALLRREAGYRVPLTALTDWARGVSHDPGAAAVAVDADGLPGKIAEAGWQISLRDYDLSQSPPLPRALEAEQGRFRVRLAIASWNPEAAHE